MPKKPGELRIIGTELHLIGEDGLEYMFEGTYVDRPLRAKKGSCWIDTDVFYIDALGDKRQVSSIKIAAVPGRIGSAWISTKNLYFIDDAKDKRMGHIDAQHADRAAYSDYGDYGSHSDSHGDAPEFNDHSDFHNDYAAYSDLPAGGVHGDSDHHGDSHGDAYNTTYHSDSHSDNVYSDHGDSYPHSDATHADMPQLVP